MRFLLHQLASFFGVYPRPGDYAPEHVEFNYLPGSVTPDRIEVYFKERYLFSFEWISGHDAFPASRLGIWYKRYQEWRSSPDPTLID